MRAFINSHSDNKIEVKVQGVRQSIYYLSDAKGFNYTSENLSNLLLLTAFPIAMKKGLDLEVSGNFDPVIVRNLEKLSVVWSQYRPDKFFRACKIIVSDGEFRDEKSSNLRKKLDKSVMAFSGGVDSMYALLRNRQMSNSHRVDHCVMINGFGYDLSESSFFKEQFTKNSEFLGLYGVSLCDIETNYKKVVAWYPFFHSMGIATVLNLFGAKYDIGAIGLDYTYKEEQELGPWGNLSLLNGLYSSSSFLIDPIGADRERVEKIKFLNEQDALKYITVCNFIEKAGKNCGNCDKCIRTMLMCVANRIDYRDIFEGDLTKKDVENINIKKNTQYIFYKSIVKRLKDHPSYQRVLESKLDKYING